MAQSGSTTALYTYDAAGIRNGTTYNFITQNGLVVRQTWGGPLAPAGDQKQET